MRLAGAMVCGLLAACGRAAGRGSLALTAAATLSALSPAQLALAQAPDPTGRDFAGVRLRVPTVPGVIEFAASKATAWTEVSTATGVTTRRLLLEDSVVVDLGESRFEAARAVVWLERLRPRGESGGDYQVYVVFEDVGSPSAAAGPGVAAHWLAVQGVIATDARPELRADLVLQGRPTADIIAKAEGELAAHLRSQLGLPEIAGLAPVIRDDPRIWRPPPPGVPGIEGSEIAIAGGPSADGATPGQGAAPGVPSGSPSLPSDGPSPAGQGAPVAQSPTGDAISIPGTSGLSNERVVTPAEEEAARDRFREAIRLLPSVIPEPPILPRGGVVTIDGVTQANFQEGTEESTVTLDGGLVVQSVDAQSGRTLVFKADRAVVFLDPGPVEQLARLDRSRVRGMYLEGAVMVTDGQYTLRGTSVYYDLRHDRAIVLDAVFNTYEATANLPIYVRAEAIRQEAAGEFTAEHPRLAASAFNRPLLTLGASAITLRRIGAVDGTATNVVRADNITLNAAGIPFFYWPIYEGDPERIPLRGIGVTGVGSSDGALRTRWDLLSLMGIDGPRDIGAQLEANLLADWYFERGAAGGIDATWSTDRGEGSLLAYGIINDVGEDRANSGSRIGRDGDTRGMILAEQRWSLSDVWTIYAEAAYVGDPLFVDAFFDRLGETRREFATGVTAQRLESNTAVTITARGSLDDFSPNEYIQAGPGYTTEKLPEFRYVRLSDDLLGSVRPGLLSYSLDLRGGYNRLNFIDPTAAELGFRTTSRSQTAFGINPDESIADRLRAQGYVEQGVWRLDARHQLDSTLHVGAVNVTPFVVGRTTLYDNDFDELSPEENDNLRLWGMAGVTASTSMQRVYNGAESRLFDVHRLRHIVEPSVTILHSASTIDSPDLPIYDDDVEGLAEGTTARFAINQTLQTERGAAGQWRSVDFLTLDAEIIWNDDDRGIESVLPRFYEARPELSDPGTFGRLAAAWQATESLGLTTDWVYSFDNNQPARTSAGYIIRHSPQLLSSGEIRYINPQNATYFDLAAQYQLTDKYSLASTLSWDVDRGEFRRARVSLRREFTAFIVQLEYTYDNIQDESSFGFALQPLGERSLALDVD